MNKNGFFKKSRMPKITNTDPKIMKGKGPLTSTVKNRQIV